MVRNNIKSLAFGRPFVAQHKIVASAELTTPSQFKLVVRGFIGLRLQELRYRRETERRELRFDAAWRFDVDSTNM